MKKHIPKNLRQVHDFLDKHIYKDLIIVDLKSHQDTYTISRCECNDWRYTEPGGDPDKFVRGNTASFIRKIAEILPNKLEIEFRKHMKEVEFDNWAKPPDHYSWTGHRIYERKTVRNTQVSR